jgi:hypothetical protein
MWMACERPVLSANDSYLENDYDHADLGLNRVKQNSVGADATLHAKDRPPTRAAGDSSGRDVRARALARSDVLAFGRELDVPPGRRRVRRLRKEVRTVAAMRRTADRRG